MVSTRIAAAAVLAAASFPLGLSGQTQPAGLIKSRDALKAAAEKKDTQAYGRLLTDDVVWVDAAGGLRTKDALAEALTVLGQQAVETRSYPSGFVVFGTRADGLVRYLQLWVQRGGDWLLAAHQGAPIKDKPAPQPTRSSKLPANAGPAAEIKAIDAAIAALQAGNAKNDGKNFAASVTDGFVGINTTGNVASKQDRMTAIAKGPNPPGQANVEETSTRIHGDLAVTNRITKTPNGRSRQMIVHAKQGGKWLRAGIITTPIATGNPSGQ